MPEGSGRQNKNPNESGQKFGFRSNKIGGDQMVNCMVKNENEMMKFMVEDLCQWLSQIVGQNMELTSNNFFSSLADGVILCRLANAIQDYAIQIAKEGDNYPLGDKIRYKSSNVCQKDKSRFQARENVCKFLDWCRSHKVPSTMFFESNDVVLGGTNGGREVIICLMNLAKRFSIEYHVPAPETVKVEVEREIQIKEETLSKKKKTQPEIPIVSQVVEQCEQQTTNKEKSSSTDYSPTPSINDDRIDEVEGSHHFGNCSEKTNDSEITPKDLESLEILLRNDPFDTTTLTTEKDVKNPAGIEEKYPIEEIKSEQNLDIVSTSIKETSSDSSNVESDKSPIEDTAMPGNDQEEETLTEMEQILINEDKFFSVSISKKCYNSAVDRMVKDCEMICEAETLDDYTLLTSIFEGNNDATSRTKSTTTEFFNDFPSNTKSTATEFCNDFPSRTKSITTDFCNDFNLCYKDSTPLLIESKEDGTHSSEVSAISPIEHGGCKCSNEHLICENCLRSSHKESLHEDEDSPNFHMDSESNQQVHYNNNPVIDDLDQLKEFCHIFEENNAEKKKMIALKFICIQVGDKYIFIKKVGRQLLVRYKHEWIPMLSLIQCVTNCTLTAN